MQLYLVWEYEHDSKEKQLGVQTIFTFSESSGKSA